ncbi:hypothetical protein BsWGS_24510 [Bradybaena similaris]
MIRPRGRYIIFFAALFIILFIPVSKHAWESLHEFGIIPRSVHPREITVVTMYLNIGGFLKGGGSNYFTPATYLKWMTTWGWLTNRVVAFFDSEEDLETFRQIRSLQPKDRTVLIKLQRSEIPAFKHLDKIRTIYRNASYPKHTPNTVYAEYSCAMNAKYDALQMAIQRGLVYTDHLAWLDIGLFRNLLQTDLRPKEDRFSLEVPENFNSSTVGMSQVASWQDMSKLSPWDYIKDNQVWVSGAFALATKETMWTFSESYKLTLKQLLDEGLSSTDQQVIGAMYSPRFIKRQQVQIVAYSCKDGQFGLYSTDIVYFCLGYICKDAAEKRLNASRTERTNNLKQRY